MYSGFEYENYVKTLSKRNSEVPKVVTDALAETVHFPDKLERLKYFIKQMQNRQLSPSTAQKYLKIFKNLVGLDAQTDLKLNKLAFKPTQSRYVPMSELELMYEHFVETNNLLMQFCFLTGLRSMEVAQFSSKHLDDLTKENSTTNIILKGGKKEWSILWTPELRVLVKKLEREFKNELQFYRETKASILLWNLQPLSISAKFKQAYVFIIRKQPPIGFGLHNIRYYWATKFADNLSLAKKKLNHSSLVTTKSYVKINANDINFDNLNNTAFYQAIFKG